MADGWPSGTDPGTHAWHGVGVRPLLCRHHGGELEIPLYPAHRFLNADYVVFDCGGMAFSEAESLASNAIVRREDSHCTTTDSDLLHGGNGMVRANGGRSLRSPTLFLGALLLVVAPLLGDANERRVTKLADDVYAIEHKYLND